MQLVQSCTSLASHHAKKVHRRPAETHTGCRPIRRTYGITSSQLEIIEYTRNTLDCDRSNDSSPIVFSHIPIKFGQTGNSAIRYADPENPTNHNQT